MRYNHVVGRANKFCSKTGEPKSEYCVRVVGGKRFGGPQWIKDKCGDGQFGFATRHKREPVRMTIGLDGQWKWDRKTCVKPKSARSTSSRRYKQIWGNKCGVVSNAQIAEIDRDPIVVKENLQLHTKMQRSRNRNYRARRGNYVTTQR